MARPSRTFSVIAVAGMSAVGATLLLSAGGLGTPAGAQADSRVDLFKDRIGSFQTLYLPIPAGDAWRLLSVDARTRQFHLHGVGPMRYDGENFWWTPSLSAGAEWDAAFSDLLDEALEGFPNTDFVPLPSELPHDIEARLWGGEGYRLDLPVEWPAPFDVLLGLDADGDPSGIAMVAPGSLTLLYPDQQGWRMGFDREEMRWDVPLLPGLGQANYGPRPPCGYDLRGSRDNFFASDCRNATSHPEYHAVYLRYEVPLNAAASLTTEPNGTYLSNPCTAGQVFTAPIDLEFPVDTADPAFARMIAARPHCPLHLVIGGRTAHEAGSTGVTTQATGSFKVLNAATGAVFFSQNFNEATPGKQTRYNPRSKDLLIPGGLALNELTVRWSGTISIQCTTASTTGNRNGIGVVADEPVFEWNCLPEDPPSSE